MSGVGSKRPRSGVDSDDEHNALISDSLEIDNEMHQADADAEDALDDYYMMIDEDDFINPARGGADGNILTAGINSFLPGMEWLKEHGRKPLTAEQEASIVSKPLIFMNHDFDFNREVPVVRIFGVTAEGQSVMCIVKNFYPYLYVPLPSRAENISMPDLMQMLNQPDVLANTVIDVSVVKKRSIFYFIPGDPELKFLKIVFRTPENQRKAYNTIMRGGLHLKRSDIYLQSQTFEGNVDYVMRFMCDHDIAGSSWIELPAHSFTIVRNKASLMQIEVETTHDKLISHRPEGAWLHTAPLRRLSFDIECAGRKGVFPEPEHDPVIQIANCLNVHGETEPLHKVVFTLKSCAAISGATVKSFDNEEDLLRAWSQYVRVTDPDILTGYNIVNFDLPFLMKRAQTLKVQEFAFLGRIANRLTKMRKTQMSSSGFGTHESNEFSMDGRVIIDMLQIIIREYKLRSYSLNNVSSEFLGEQKEDVHYSIISDLQAGTAQTRRRLAIYCLKDALLPQRLMDRLMALTNYMEMARVTGIPLDWLVTRGHMIKVVSLLHRKAFGVNLLIPDLPRSRGTSDGPQFEGATVIEPQKGFYKDPIATLDFASLYPSIIMAHNLCYSTLIRKEHVPKMRPEDYITTPTGDHFARVSVKKGVLSSILEELLSARKQAKRDLGAETDPFRKGVLNGRQLALKISANAVYGFTGATVGKLPCMEISASTTSFGRDMIHFTKKSVEEHYPNSTVIYGDTDSVMVDFGGKSLEESMRLGHEAAELISKSFPRPVKLEFEKCYFPYLLINKKRYAGLFWTNTTKFDKMDCKGIESVRRDNCRLVANMISTVLDKLLIEKDVDGAVQFVKDTISALLQNKIDLSLLVVSKALTKSEGKYDSKQAHVTLAEKMRKRDPGTAPSLGDRVPYVITTGRKGQPSNERAEDPLYVMEHSIPIDNDYYLENMLKKPLERIFEAILDNPSVLFQGAHTRSITVSTPKTGIMKFAKISLTCLGCRTPIKEGAVCANCSKKESVIYRKVLADVSELELAYSALWTECQRCMGDICQDVLCSNGDCPIFYRRHKVALDLETTVKKLDRFTLEW